MKCYYCSDPIDEKGDYRQVLGWTRIKRSGGGTNAIRATERQEVFACRWCIDKLVKGTLGQEQLAL